MFDPSSLTALGRKSLPDRIEVHRRRYRQVRVFKNDFFAITAMYEGPDGRVILKVHRQASFLLVPLQWIGRLLARREKASLQRLAHLDGIPRLIDDWGPTGLVRDYIPGHPLARGERVSDDFHQRLRVLVEGVHAEGMAYVDLEKCENVLVGDDGLPYLFDFQIAWLLPRRLGGDLWPMRALRGWLQQGDRYHLVKLHRRTRPDQLSPQRLAASYRKPWHLHVQRFVCFPFLWCRRRILQRLDPRRGSGERGRVGQEELTSVV